MKALIMKQYRFEYRAKWKFKNYPKRILEGLFYVFLVGPRMKRQIEPGKFEEVEKHQANEQFYSLGRMM